MTTLANTAVMFRIFSPDGLPENGVGVSATLTRPDVDGGTVVPSFALSSTTDSNGECILHLWPNSRGTTGSQYRVVVSKFVKIIDEYSITVQESPSMVLVESIRSTPPYPPISAAQQALEAAQQAVIDASNASRLSIGTVATLNPGASATASITGDAGAQQLNLGIPRGADGAGGTSGPGAVTSVAGRTGDVTLAKADVGLGNVDNTADASKPVSTAQAAADSAVAVAAAADATGKVSAHAAATDPHGDRAYASSADAAILSTARAYADSLVVGLVDDRGNYNASGNTFPASGGSGTAGAVLKGDLWTVSVGGALGGVAVTPGDLVRALVDAPGQTAGNWAVTENNIGYTPENAANKNATGGYAGLTGFAINLKNALGTITSFFATAATAARTWTFPDKDGTVAMTSDITAANAGAVPTTGGTITDTTSAVGGSSAGSALTINQTFNTTGTPTAFKVNVTDGASNPASLVADFQVGGSSVVAVSKTGLKFPVKWNDSGGSLVSEAYYRSLTWTSVTTGSNVELRNCGLEISSSNSNYSAIYFSNASSVGTPVLRYDAAGTLAQRNGTNAQTKRLYGTWTDASNGRWLEFAMSTAGAAVIKATGNGTGASGNTLTAQRLIAAGFATSIAAKTADYTATPDDHTITVDASGGARTITGFACSGNAGKRLTIKKTDSSANAVTFDPNASETVDGASTKATSTQYGGFTVQVNEAGTAWFVVATF